MVVVAAACCCYCCCSSCWCCCPVLVLLLLLLLLCCCYAVVVIVVVAGCYWSCFFICGYLTFPVFYNKLSISSLQNEYEECINTILRGKRELLFVVGKLAQTVGGMPTLRYLTDSLNISFF